MRLLNLTGLLMAAPSVLVAQSRSIPENIKPFVSVDAPVVALTNVRLIDGTGATPKAGQTVVIDGDRIVAVGAAGTVSVPAGAQRLDLSGHTVIPGLIGLHNHMYYSAPGGSMNLMPFSYPRLFLATGVTTVRTTGSVDSYRELNLKREIDMGHQMGPDIHVTGPYLQGPGPGPESMHPLSGPEDARRVVRYWAEEGVSWFKAYTQISRAELGAAIEEAHKRGIKVTAHLCSVGYLEAAELGIDNLEHGLLTNTEYWSGKQPDICPMVSSSVMFADVDVRGPEVQRTIREMLKRNVAMTSTLAVKELSMPGRMERDPRVFEALSIEARRGVEKWLAESSGSNDEAANRALQKAVEFEREFVRAGGLLAAGSDPCCLSSIAGYADQRNYEMLVEGGFAPEEAVQIMTHNGARVLGIDADVGTIEPGKHADLVVLRGDLLSDASRIRQVRTVFRRGIGYDSAKLIESVRGQVGIH